MMDLSNKYSKLVEFSAQVINGIFSVDFGKVSVAPSIATVTTTTAADGIKDFGEQPFEIDAEYGRNLVVVAAAANTSAVEITGYDYLGQPVKEIITLNGTTAVKGVKAFKFISKIVNVAGTAATITVTGGLKLGLPYRTASILAETRGGVKSTTSTLVAPINTVQTATSSDPRGLVDLGTYSTPTHVVLVCLASPEIFTINDELVGGLYGLPHFYA